MIERFPLSSHRVIPAIFAAAILLSVSACANAQQVGVKAGINYTYFLPEEDQEVPFYFVRGAPDLSPASGSACRSRPASRFK